MISDDDWFLMNNIVVVGLQWGDEGKGKIVDYLSDNADAVVRFQGGNNAGHTIVVNGQVYKLNLLPSSVLRPGKVSLIGNGVVLDPYLFIKEIEVMQSKGIEINPSNLMISEGCPLILNVHKEKEVLFRSSDKIGTTSKGIGPCYEDKIGRRAIRLCDLVNVGLLDEKVDTLLNYHNVIRKGFGSKLISKEEVIEEILGVSEKILPYKKRVSNILDNFQDEGKKIIFEGAQGTFLDIDHGTYPFVTSSNTIACTAIVGSGLFSNNYVLGVTKAYTTRVGNGPFPTEQKNEMGDILFTRGKEIGTVSNRKRRCGWFDAVLIRHAIKLSGVSSIVLTKLDILDSFDTIKICVKYKYDNNEFDYLPASYEIQERLEPVYEELPGWKKNTQAQRFFNELPINLARYVKRIEELVGVPVSLISTSPNREDVVVLRNLSTFS